MEVGEVRKRVQRAIDAARERALRRRERADAAEQAYERFLQDYTYLSFNGVKLPPQPGNWLPLS